MLFGAHVSIAGGVQNAPRNAAALGCEVLQMFTRSPQGGPAPKLTPEVIREFRLERERAGIQQVAVHTPYYINLASEAVATRTRSAAIIREELERASLLGAEYCMTHLGSSKGVPTDVAMEYVTEGVRTITKDYTGSCTFLIEISAGAGDVIGDTFEEIAEILQRVGDDRIGICFDTQHAFASGYDLRTPQAVRETFDAFDRTIGLSRLKMSHCNDSLVELGAKKDRHEHIGKGKIGIEGFRTIVHEPRLASMNLYLETAPDAVAEDLALLKALREEKR